jgi:hypothetical protein
VAREGAEAAGIEPAQRQQDIPITPCEVIGLELVVNAAELGQGVDHIISPPGRRGGVWACTILSATKCLQRRREECEGREPLRVFRQLDREDMEKRLTPPPGEPEGVQPIQ